MKTVKFYRYGDLSQETIKKYHEMEIDNYSTRDVDEILKKGIFDKEGYYLGIYENLFFLEKLFGRIIILQKVEKNAIEFIVIFLIALIIAYTVERIR